MDGDVAGEEPTLNAEAGLTPASAAAAGSRGYVDNALHAGTLALTLHLRLVMCAKAGTRESNAAVFF